MSETFFGDGGEVEGDGCGCESCEYLEDSTVFPVECEDACDYCNGSRCCSEDTVAVGAIDGYGADERCGECYPWEE